jgi:hypothetical protein
MDTKKTQEWLQVLARRLEKTTSENSLGKQAIDNLDKDLDYILSNVSEHNRFFKRLYSDDLA